MGNLAKRIATAAVAIPILLAAIFIDSGIIAILALTALAAVPAYDEYVILAAGGRGSAALRRAGSFSAAAVVLAAGALGPAGALAHALVASGLFLGVLCLLGEKELAAASRSLAALWSGLLYVPALLSYLPLLKRDLGEAGPAWLCLALAMAFMSDTLAYAAGRSLGRHRLHPELSPGKTWEGAMGGILGAMAAALVGSLCFASWLSIPHALVLGAAASLAGQLGDLVESMLKRAAGVKESGALLPGHGGILDRIDGLLFVGPVVYAYARFVAPGAGA